MNKLTLEQIPRNAFLNKDGQQGGPYSVDQINEFLAKGHLHLTDLIWVEGWPEWKQLSSLAPSSPLPPPITVSIPENEKPNIHLTKDGQQIGPFTLKEINSKLVQGTIVRSDLAWMEGLAGWVPISDILARDPQPPAFSPEQSAKSAPFSGHAIASLVLALLGIPLIFGAGLWFFIGAVIEAYVAKRSIQKHGYRGGLMANFSLWIGIIGVIGVIVLSVLMAVSH